MEQEKRLLEIVVAIDDTDELGSKGTGELAQELLRLLTARGWGNGDYVTRHQLFLHPDIAYTSHNSSMAFRAQVQPQALAELSAAFVAHLQNASAATADPGLCIVDCAALRQRERLIEFAYRAKRQALTKQAAYDTARQCGLFLRECGGDGLGVIGALAGCGLRLDGNDGELKGGLSCFAAGQLVSAGQLRQQARISDVLDADLKPLPDKATVRVAWKVKPILHQGQPVLLVVADAQNPGGWLSFSKQEMRDFGAKRASVEACAQFAPDVAEEQVPGGDTCFNCRFRRWQQGGFSCMYDQGRQ